MWCIYNGIFLSHMKGWNDATCSNIHGPGEDRGGFPGSTAVKNHPCRRHKKWEFDPWAGKIPCSRKWQPASVYLLGNFPWTKKPSSLQSMGLQRVGHDWATKRMRAHTHTHTHTHTYTHTHTDDHTKWSMLDRERWKSSLYKWCYLQVKLKKKNTNELIYNTVIYSQRKQTWLSKEKRGLEG